MDCLRNHGPRMKFRLGHAKVNNPPRSEVISRGATQRRRRREGKKKKKKRQRFSSYSHVLFAGSRGCSEARVSSHQRLLRGRRGKWSSSVRYGLVIPLAISLPLLAFPTPFYTFCYSIFSPFLSRSLASFPVPLLFFIFIYIYIPSSLFFNKRPWRREETTTIFGGGEATQQKGNQLRFFSFQGTKARLEAFAR